MPETNPYFDPILDELHAVRRQMLEASGGDLTELVARLQRDEQQSGHPIATIPVKRESTQEPKEATALKRTSGP